MNLRKRHPQDPRRPQPISRPPQTPQPQDSLQDPLVAVLLYLSHLDHEHLYSEEELSRAIHDCHRSYGSVADLCVWYRQSLGVGQAVTVVQERRDWALNIASHLAHRHPYDRSLPWCSGVTLAEAFRTVGADRTLRRARRRAFLVAAPVIGLYLLISCLGETAENIMATRVVGLLNVGLLLGLVQLAAVVAWLQWYGRYCRTTIDPLVESPVTPIERLEHQP
ncbi:DUF485 domain-containing protein [Streptomyces scabiei]|uniref:DUF485 domain-containing protein n=1 Tax=Streptomyces scabiei TaxID=1930 RepID=UPI0004E70518|nr:DUF485 domain-containing protein [Streptomyces scabiei]KFG09993.1 hypothetical protein IQ61_05200 [Streptomyces scabiei]MDX2835649.1 DUF485 domain-containing protein [Streptomyces scabiei]MDX3680430.1 DUF485 domain-containing protein [Streptomyces scabiei]